MHICFVKHHLISKSNWAWPCTHSALWSIHPSHFCRHAIPWYEVLQTFILSLQLCRKRKKKHVGWWKNLFSRGKIQNPPGLGRVLMQEQIEPSFYKRSPHWDEWRVLSGCHISYCNRSMMSSRFLWQRLVDRFFINIPELFTFSLSLFEIA